MNKEQAIKLIGNYCTMNGITYAQLKSYRKTWPLAIIRGTLYAYFQYETDISASEAGRLLHRKHSTVIKVGDDFYYNVERNDDITKYYNALKKLHNRIEGTPLERRMESISCRIRDEL